MSAIPIFIEMPAASDAAICGKVVQMLTERKVEPIGFATSLAELSEILKTLKDLQLEPAIFILNTFKAKDIIPQLDPLIGDKPAVYLRRGMYAGQSGLMTHLVPDVSKMNTMSMIKNMTPRLTSVWTYGAKNADQVASKLLNCTLKFVADKNFRHYEIANQV